MTESIEIKILSYRNGYYQGQLKNNQRHGYGILSVDNGPLIVGSWKNDMLFGKAFLLISN